MKRKHITEQLLVITPEAPEDHQREGILHDRAATSTQGKVLGLQPLQAHY